MTLVTCLGVEVLVEALRAAPQALTPLSHEDKVLSTVQAVSAPRTHTQVTGRVTALAKHGGGVAKVTEKGVEEFRR